MSLDEQWPTPELIQAAVDRFTARMPGWTPTAAYGVAFVPTDDGIGWSFPVVNVGWLHRLLRWPSGSSPAGGRPREPTT